MTSAKLALCRCSRIRRQRCACAELRPYQEATLRIGTEPPPPLMSAPLFGPLGATVDTDHAVVIAANATTIAMVMIFRISLSIPEMSRSAFPDSGKVD